MGTQKSQRYKGMLGVLRKGMQRKVQAKMLPASLPDNLSNPRAMLPATALPAS